MTAEVPTRPLAERREDPRYVRLMAATREAALGGYDAVSMRDLAQASRMSLKTIYEFCSSKDHLIAAAHYEWMERVRLRTLPRSRGRSAQSRLLAHMGEVTDAWQRHEVLMRTFQRALYSLDPAVNEIRASLRSTHEELMERAIGDDEIANRAAVIDLLGQVLDSVTFRWVCRAIDAPDARVVLENAVRTLVPKGTLSGG